ncbi:MAG TPA: 7-cyano-7-deazaguanine synthase [Candidatus Binataceae bacterium]|nr:7-cyano-7-deazaguanine synthase [Candidatus Binataceae bacterium]
MEKIAVLASGGLDSGALLADLSQSAQVYPIYVRCGLAWELHERQALQIFLTALDSPNLAPITDLAASTSNIYGEHWSMTGKSVPGADEPDNSVFLPGRNILLIGLAAVWCSTHEIPNLAIGSLGGNPFPDATPGFFTDFAKALSSGLGHRINVSAPFRSVHKDEIIRRFKHLPLELTLTCMAPRGRQHCGECNKCRERQVGFARASVPDPTVYSR